MIRLWKIPTGLNLRDYQIRAINKATEAIVNGNRTALLAMATGTGKTRTVLGFIYKMLESKRFRRILFLVDRVSLGEQAMDTFKDVKLKDLMTLNEIYELKSIDDNEINLETKVSVSTVQGLLRRTILSETPDLMPGAFDLIIVDEAHRGYILDREMTQEEILYDNQDDYMSKYKQVIEYFDAVKVALTATPALHTTEIFGKPIFTYSYREAVIDGWLVDHDPPYIINTGFIENHVKFKKGETLAQYDPNTNELVNGAVLQDELDFDVSDFNRKIILPDHTRKVLEEISNYLNPESREKTLIFAVNDNHADCIVDTLRHIYEPCVESDVEIIDCNEAGEIIALSNDPYDVSRVEISKRIYNWNCFNIGRKKIRSDSKIALQLFEMAYELCPDKMAPSIKQICKLVHPDTPYSSFAKRYIKFKIHDKPYEDVIVNAIEEAHFLLRHLEQREEQERLPQTPCLEQEEK